MRTQSRIALTIFLSNVMIILLFGGAIYYFLNKYSYTDFYKRLETRASIAAKYNLQADRLSAEALKTVREQHLERLFNEKAYLVEVTTETPVRSIASKFNLPKGFPENVFINGKANLKDHDTFYAGLRYDYAGKTYIVVVSAVNYYSSHHLSFLRNIIFAGLFLIALLATAFSLYFSKRIFEPIRQITLKVKQISTENIHLRLEQSENHNEISELVHTFNDLLNRLETAFETQKNFISNASHEFGTPLTSIIGEAEVTLLKLRSPEEYHEVLKNVLKQAERMDKITKSLLFLAQTGYGSKKIKFDVTRMDEIVWSCKELMDNLNPGNKIFIDLGLLPDDPTKLKVNGNKELLQLAVANILNNACKYSNNQPVTISIASTYKEVVIVVHDKGVGIPANELQFIYDPFFRASNTYSFEGYGIGLPLTRNIIHLHKGTLDVQSVVNEGTTVKINLPVR